MYARPSVPGAVGWSTNDGKSSPPIPLARSSYSVDSPAPSSVTVTTFPSASHAAPAVA